MKLFVVLFAIVAVVAATEAPANDYLPPAETVVVEQVSVEPQESAVLADDGYRYKTVRRLKYRHRRDVNELPSNDYLPPAASAPVAVVEQHFAAASAPVAQQETFAAPQETAVLADDGYRYKTVRRLKYRHRRDVNELPSNDYLPPAASAPVAVVEQHFAAASAPVAQQETFAAPQETAVLADDGYRYKTVRRLKYRHRRDVNELPSNDYLPPAASAPVAVVEQHFAAASAPVAQQEAFAAPQETAVLADDGYRYKTVRRLKYRHRRDVNELPSNDYLPPAASAPVAVVEQQFVAASAPVAQQQDFAAPQETAVLADDGYRYKTVRRLKYRHRRDVNELPSNDYLPPAASAPVAVVEQQFVAASAPVAQQQDFAAPQETAVLADDGYRYKTVRRLKYRQRRV